MSEYRPISEWTCLSRALSTLLQIPTAFSASQLRDFITVIKHTEFVQPLIPNSKKAHYFKSIIAGLSSSETEIGQGKDSTNKGHRFDDLPLADQIEILLLLERHVNAKVCQA